MEFVTFLLLVLVQRVYSFSGNFYQKVKTCDNNPRGHYVNKAVSSDSECAALCAEDDRCGSFSILVSQTTRTCYLNTKFQIPTGCSDEMVNHFNTNPICLNNGEYNDVTHTCKCVNSYVGDRCERLMTDCVEGFQSGHYNGKKTVFTIHPATSPVPFKVFCEMEFGGELLIMRRKAFSDPAKFVNFSRSWDDYRDGFGNLKQRNFWLGLEKVHQVTNSGRRYLLIVTAFVTEPNAKYRQHFYYEFKVSSEGNGYSFTSTYHKPNDGNGGVHVLNDCMWDLRGQRFSTMDRDNDASAEHCAMTRMSGWWFKDCAPCNPTGLMQPLDEQFISADPKYASWPVTGDMSTRILNLFLKPY